MFSMIYLDRMINAAPIKSKGVFFECELSFNLSSFISLFSVAEEIDTILFLLSSRERRGEYFNDRLTFDCS